MAQANQVAIRQERETEVAQPTAIGVHGLTTEYRTPTDQEATKIWVAALVELGLDAQIVKTMPTKAFVDIRTSTEEGFPDIIDDLAGRFQRRIWQAVDQGQGPLLRQKLDELQKTRSRRFADPSAGPAIILEADSFF